MENIILTLTIYMYVKKAKFTLLFVTEISRQTVENCQIDVTT